GLLWLRQLVQTVNNAIQMHTPIGKGLFNGLFDEIGRILLVELQDADKLLHTSAFRPFLLQVCKHPRIGRWPLFTPFLDGFGVLKGTWSLLKQGKIMQRIKNILFFAIASGVVSQQVPFLIKDINEIWIR